MPAHALCDSCAKPLGAGLFGGKAPGVVVMPVGKLLSFCTFSLRKETVKEAITLPRDRLEHAVCVAEVSPNPDYHAWLPPIVSTNGADSDDKCLISGHYMEYHCSCKPGEFVLTVAATTAVKSVPAYPVAAVEAALQEELLRAVRGRFRRRGLPLPEYDAEIMILAIKIDSLTVVEILSSLDDILPFKVTESVVKAGGYKSIGAAVKHVTARVESKWMKYYSGGNLR